jgi:[ribosomal protein S5]-alanine N-acetyltransferase
VSSLEILDLSYRAGPVIIIDGDMQLRPLAEAEVTQRYVDRINDPDVSRYLVSARSGPQTIDDVRAMVAANWEATNAILFGMFSHGMHCGNIRLHDVTLDRAFIGIAVFEPGMQRRGIGSRAIRAVVDYAFSELSIKEIVAGIDESNSTSQKAFSRAGFVKLSHSPDGKGSLWHYYRALS